MPRRVLSDSESDIMLSSSVHSDSKLEQGLRRAIADIFEAGNLSELTVKRVRLATENALGLEEGFFKGDANWKAKSDQIIKEEAEEKIKAQGEKKQKAKEDSPVAPIKPTRRVAHENSPGPSKRQKTTALSESIEELSSDEDQGGKPVKKSAKQSPKKKSKPRITENSPSTDSDVGDGSGVTRVAPKKSGSDKGASANEQSDSLVEDPKPTRKRQKVIQKKTSKRKTKGPAKQDISVDPDQEEIKRLQGWLVKCGIRKMWSRELAPYGTSRDKIKHLKEMLKSAGMEGRYSLEKARQIREERELQQDIKLVQEGNRLWGKKSGGEESDGGKPRKKLARGLKATAFLGDDGEETD